ncbi:ADP-ribose diphosphatase [Ceratobasidium sp. AG-Ba]|nr:ADP-ribose diphosphatase [Ceratobasidium sp. AG-Ba]
MAFNDGDSSRWKRECESLNYMNHQLRRELEDTRQALQDATKDAQAAREESAELKRKVETFWDSIEEARASFVRSFPNYTYRDSHKRSREATSVTDRAASHSARSTQHASGSGPPIAPGPPRDARRSRHDYAEGILRTTRSSEFHAASLTSLCQPVRPTHPPNGRSPYDTPARPLPRPRPPPWTARVAQASHPTSRPAFRLTKATAMPLATPTHTPTPNHRHTRAMLVVNPPTQSRSRASAGQPMPSRRDVPQQAGLAARGGHHHPPPAAFQVSFADLQPGIFLDRADFGAEYPPNLDPPQGLQAVSGRLLSVIATCRNLDPSRQTVNLPNQPRPARSLRLLRLSKHRPVRLKIVFRHLNVRLPPVVISLIEASGELESEDDQEPFDYQRHRRDTSRTETRKADTAPNGHNSGTGSPLTHAALENGIRVEVARGVMLLDGKVRDRFLENHWARTRPHPAGAEMEGKTVLQKAARTSSVNGVFAGAQIPGEWINQVQAQDEWLCEIVIGKQHSVGKRPIAMGRLRKKIVHPPPAVDGNTSPGVQRASGRAEQTRPVEADGASGSDTEPVRSGASSVPRKINVRRVLSESQSPKPAGEAATDGQSEPSSVRAPPAPLPDEARGSEPPEQNRSIGSPARKKGWKGYALIPVPGDEGSTRSGHTAEVVTTPGGTRRTRSGKAYIADDGVSASGSERQQAWKQTEVQRTNSILVNIFRLSWYN